MTQCSRDVDDDNDDHDGLDGDDGGMEIHVLFFISTPFFSAQPGVAYRKAVFEPQVCLDVCLTNQTTFKYEITKK